MKRREFLAATTSAFATGLSFPSVLSAEGSDVVLDFAREIIGPSSAPLRGLIPQGSEANLAPVVAEWESQTGQKVDLSTVPVDDINARMTIDGLTGLLNFDFALPATFGIPDLISAGVVRPFDQIRQGMRMSTPTDTGLYEIGDFFGGERYGFQTDGDVYLMFYRADMLDDPAQNQKYEDQFGGPMSLPKDWSELDRQMEFFHKPSEGRYGGALFRIPGYLGWEFIARVLAAQGCLFSVDLEPRLDNDRAEQVIEDMRRATDFLHPAVAHAGLFQNWDLYKSEDIYANIGWGGSQKAFNQQNSRIRGKMHHAMLPGLAEKNLSYFNWGWSYVVPSGALQPAAGYLFSRFAVSERASLLAVGEKDGYFDPFHSVHYSDPAVIQAYSEPFLDVHKKAMKMAGHNFNLPGHGSYMASLNENLSQALNGRLSAREALNVIEAEWELTTLEIGSADQTRRWKELLTPEQQCFG